MQVKNPTVIRPYENCIKLLLFSWPSLSNYIVTCRARMCHDWKMLSACAQVCVCVCSAALMVAQNLSVVDWGRRYSPLEHHYIICHDVKRDTLSCPKKHREIRTGKC